VIETAAVFIGAYLSEKSAASRQIKLLYQVLAIIPISVPGLVIGLSYIFFLNNPRNPLEVLYGTFTILVGRPARGYACERWRHCGAPHLAGRAWALAVGCQHRKALAGVPVSRR
jgi:hypothetical protein